MRRWNAALDRTALNLQGPNVIPRIYDFTYYEHRLLKECLCFDINYWNGTNAVEVDMANKRIENRATTEVHTIDLSGSTYIYDYRISLDRLLPSQAIALRLILSDGAEHDCGNFDDSTEIAKTYGDVGDCHQIPIFFRNEMKKAAFKPQLTRLWISTTCLEIYSPAQVAEFLAPVVDPPTP